MMNRRQPRWGACVALVAAYALVLSALLSSLAPLAQGRANPLDGPSIAICLSSGNAATQDKAPDAPMDHRHDACCILCMVQGLAATSDEIRFTAPEYQSSRSSPLTPLIAAGPLGAAELLPINPRAPPRSA
jgi:hypothetical protein